MGKQTRAIGIIRVSERGESRRRQLHVAPRARTCSTMLRTPLAGRIELGQYMSRDQVLGMTRGWSQAGVRAHAAPARSLRFEVVHRAAPSPSAPAAARRAGAGTPLARLPVYRLQRPADPPPPPPPSPLPPPPPPTSAAAGSTPATTRSISGTASFTNVMLLFTLREYGRD